MACDNILYYHGDECATNYAGVAARIFVVPMSPSLEAGKHNRSIIQKWKSESGPSNGESSVGFRSLRLPAEFDEESEEKTVIIGAVAIDIDPLKSSFGSPSQGPQRGKTFNNELKVNLIGRSLDDIDLLVALVLANKIGVVFKDANGNYRLMADIDFPVDAQVDDQSGEGPSSEAAASVTFSQTAINPPFFYRGLLSYGVSFNVKDSINTIDCMTGLDVENDVEEDPVIEN